MNLKLNDKFNIKITSQNNEGFGVSKIDDVVVFINNALPDDEGTVKITGIKKNYVIGEWESLDKVSPQRKKAPCPYFNECGGCDLQHQDYNNQLSFKKNKVKNALERIGGFKQTKVNDTVFDKDFGYRNKLIVRVKGNILGLYKPNSNEIIDIKECIICNEKINETLKLLHQFIIDHPDNSLTEIMIRTNDEKVMINITDENNYLNNDIVTYLLSKTNNITSLFLNNKLLYGDNYIIKKIDNFKFKLSPLSFYQVNDQIMKKLYDKVIEYISTQNNDTVIDLYCGIGTISSMLSKVSNNVIGIELNGEAVKNANENKELNDLYNITYMHGKVEYLLSNLFNKKVDTIVLDPPRSGVVKEAIEAIIKINPKMIIYVSCNPGTLARDLKLLKDDYNIEEITPFDMFPQTNHIECVVLLKEK